MDTERTTDGRDAILATASSWASAPPPDVVAELNNLVQAYALFTDEGRADELASLFTADATWDGTDLGYGSARGPKAIAACVLQHFDPTRPMIHVPGPPLLVLVSDSEVRGAGWCLATRSAGDGASPLIYFHYDDGYRRDDGGWRFSSRTLLLRFRSATG
jgi:SnoaL-like domain